MRASNPCPISPRKEERVHHKIVMKRAPKQVIHPIHGLSHATRQIEEGGPFGLIRYEGIPSSSITQFLLSNDPNI